MSAQSRRDFWKTLAACGLAAGWSVPARAQSTRQTIQQVLPKLVKIFGAGGLARLQGAGTGFLISPQGHIATVWSPILDAPEVTVVLNDGRRYKGKLAGIEPRLDLAVLKIDADDLPCFPMDESPAIGGPGTRVLAFSNMFRVASGNEPVSVIHGVISARTKLQGRRGRFEIIYPEEVYIVDAITNNSSAAGGVLTTREGQLLGVIGKELRNAESNTWVNYAYPVETWQPVLQEIIAGNYTGGVETASKNQPAGSGLQASDLGLVLIPDVVVRTPAYVERVVADSQAADAGFQTNDLVLFVNGELVKSCRHLQQILSQAEAGSQLEIVVRRQGQLVTYRLTVPMP